VDLDQLLNDRYPDEQLTDDFRQRYLDERAALQGKARLGQLNAQDGL
jgi:hypothetical protein